MRNAYIAGSGFYVPPRIVTNDDLASEYGIETSDEWIRQRTGIEQRHFADAGTTTSDLAVHASERAIEAAGIDRREIDMVIFATLSPDQFFPGSACFLQQKLGLCDGDDATFVAALDIRNQCSGFVYGLATATSMVRSGQHDNVLLVGSEIHSAALDLTTRGRTVGSLFGDAAGAVIVRATDEDRGVRAWDLGADGRFADQLAMKVFDFHNRPYIATDEAGNGVVPVDLLWPIMEGQVVFRNAIARMIESLTNLCEKEDVALGDIDLFLCHQANLRINQMVQNRIGAPEEKFFNNIQKYGNTTAATIPILIDEAIQAGRLERGMKVALVAFGAGFTWGSALIDW
ncbi:MAG: ketoacyl-ACP synthase III [Myxococcales bacterium]|nr:ketoacyl-ACP synthase III [Myxococcales bacterium]